VEGNEVCEYLELGYVATDGDAVAEENEDGSRVDGASFSEPVRAVEGRVELGWGCRCV